MKRARDRLWIALPALLLGVLALTACRDESPENGAAPGGGPGRATAVTTPDPNAENPDRGHLVDLSRRPFRPEWVGGTLRISRRARPKLNSILATDGESKAVAQHFLYPSLLRILPDAVDGRLEMRPWVARALPTLCDDKLTYTFHLRDDLSWEDGTPLLARDYVASWELINDEKVDCAKRREALGSFVASVSASDDDPLRLEVRCSEPFYNAAVVIGIELPAVPRGVPTDPDAFNSTERHQSYGPYRVTHFDDHRLEMVLRDEYRETPFPLFPRYVERVEIRFRAADLEVLPLLKSGEVDVTTIDPDAFAALESDTTFQQRAWATSYILPQWAFMAWNQTEGGDLATPNALFADRRVRKAMTHLVARERLCREYFHDRAVMVTGPFFFKDACYDPEVEPLAYDPAEAGRLLDEAGWRLDDKGYRVKDGKRFEFTLLAPGFYWAKAITSQFGEALRKNGITMTVEPLTSYDPVYAKSYEAFLLRNSLRPPINFDFYDLFHSAEAAKSASNFVGMRDPKIDAILDAYRAEFDDGKRVALGRALHRAVDEHHPYTFLFSIGSGVGISRKWANVKVHDLGIWYRDFVLRELWEKYPPGK